MRPIPVDTRGSPTVKCLMGDTLRGPAKTLKQCRQLATTAAQEVLAELDQAIRELPEMPVGGVTRTGGPYEAIVPVDVGTGTPWKVKFAFSITATAPHPVSRQELKSLVDAHGQQIATRIRNRVGSAIVAAMPLTGPLRRRL